jgi:hypothetical protein
VRSRGGGIAALVTVALLVTNAVLFRYGYSSTTDAVALAFQAVSLWALLAWRGPAAPGVAGGAAALATLTRYSSAYLVPGAIVYLVALAGGPLAPRRASLAKWLAAFSLVTVPWTAASAVHGHWPGEALVSNAAFYASPSARERNVQDLPENRDASGARPGQGSLVRRLVVNAPAHLAQDVRLILGWPTAGLCLLGLLFMFAERRARAWLPLGLHGALAFLALAPVFYSDRYSLAVLPFYLSLAGAAASSSRLAALPHGARWLAPAGLCAWPFAASIDANIRLQRFVYGQLPRDVLAARAGRTAGGIARRRPGRTQGSAGVLRRQAGHRVPAAVVDRGAGRACEGQPRRIPLLLMVRGHAAARVLVSPRHQRPRSRGSRASPRCCSRPRCSTGSTRASGPIRRGRATRLSGSFTWRAARFARWTTVTPGMRTRSSVPRRGALAGGRRRSITSKR